MRPSVSICFPIPGSVIEGSDTALATHELLRHENSVVEATRRSCLRIAVGQNLVAYATSARDDFRLTAPVTVTPPPMKISASGSVTAFWLTPMCPWASLNWFCTDRKRFKRADVTRCRTSLTVLCNGAGPSNRFGFLYICRLEYSRGQHEADDWKLSKLFDDLHMRT